MDTHSAHKKRFCRHPKCNYLEPGPSMVQRGGLRLLLRGVDLFLVSARHPERVFERIAHFNRRLCGLKLMKKTVDDRVWSYLESGAGEHVVMLHGFGADKDRLGGMWHHLRQSYHVVIPDLPGFGDHIPDWSASYGVEDQVRRLNRFINAVGLKKIHLMGISLGGYIAAYYAACHPDRVKSLFLMDSAGFSSPVCSDAWQLFHSHKRNILLPSSGRELQDMFDFLFHQPVQLTETLKMYWIQPILDQFSWRQKMLEDLLDNGLELMDGLARNLSMPTLVVWGAQDRICHVSTVENIIERISRCRAYIIDGCGHIPLVEFPWLSQYVYMGFLRQVRD